jgi:hypothetical protein
MKEAMYVKQSKESRLKSFQENCDAVEEISYRKKFTATEMAEHKDLLAASMIELGNIEAELANIKEDFKDKMDPIKSTIKRVVMWLESGDREVVEPCFKFIDRKDIVTGYYNESGELVRERPATTNELQLTIKYNEES